MAVASAGKSSPTITADALVVRAAGAYLGLETNVNSPGPACSIPLSPVISVSGDPFSKRRVRAAAMADSFMELEKNDRTPGIVSDVTGTTQLGTELRFAGQHKEKPSARRALV